MLKKNLETSTIIPIITFFRFFYDFYMSAMITNLKKPVENG